MYDLLISANRVFCSATGQDGLAAVAVIRDRIVAVGPEVGGSARETLHFPDGLLLPGLVDLHAHPDRGASKYGIDPDRELLPFGTTTVLSQGDAGADHWEQYLRETIQPSQTRVRLALNLARHGEAVPGPAFGMLEAADVEACVATIQHADASDPTGRCASIWGIATNASVASCGDTDPRPVLQRALAAAERTGRPLLFGPRRATDWPLREQLALLRPGDVVTYCFSPGPEGLVLDGRVREEVWVARERGIRFDLGHGMGSFSFPVAEAAIAQGFLPDTLSTDFYRRHLEQLSHHDLPHVLSKLIAAGMSEADAFVRVTANPSAILGLSGEVGTLAVGVCADLVLLRWNPNAAPLSDTEGVTRTGGCWEPTLTVCAGKIVGGTQ